MTHRIAAGLLSVALLVALSGCRNSSESRYLEAADSLVPPQSEVTRISENTGRRVLDGPYYVGYDVSDGDLGPSLADAIDDQAIETGWQQTLREQHRGGFELRYERDDLSALVYVFTKEEPIWGSITIRRTADFAVPSASAR